MKKIIYYSEKDLDGLREVAKSVDFGVGLAVMSAFSEMLSAYCMMIERSDVFRHEVKRLCKRAIRLSELRSAAIRSNMKDGVFWDDYSDAVIDAAKSDVTLFRLAIKQVLDDACCDQALLYAYVECARVLLDMSVKYYDAIMEEARKKHGRDYGSDFAEYRVGGIQKVWEDMCDRLFVGKANLNTPSVDAAFKVMCRKFAEGDYIAYCMGEAHKNNPDFVENEILVRDDNK